MKNHFIFVNNEDIVHLLNRMLDTVYHLSSVEISLPDIRCLKSIFRNIYASSYPTEYVFVNVSSEIINQIVENKSGLLTLDIFNQTYTAMNVPVDCRIENPFGEDMFTFISGKPKVEGFKNPTIIKMEHLLAYTIHNIAYKELKKRFENEYLNCIKNYSMNMNIEKALRSYIDNNLE